MWWAISPHEYPLLLKLDKKLYPTNSPVTEAHLEVWFSKNPEFGLVLTVGDDADREYNDTTKPVVAPIFGFFVCIPLAKAAWEKLIAGEIEESDVSAQDVFDVGRDDELYLHIYHMEKDIHGTAGTAQPNSGQNYSFVHEALRKVAELIEALGAENAAAPQTTNRIRLGGISALCVSESGIRICERLGFREETFVSEEYIVVDSGGGEIEVHTFPTTEHAQEICAKEGKRIVNRTKLLVARRRRDMEDGVSNNIWKTYF